MCVCVCIFFIHSLVDGYLACFHVLTTVNRAAVDTGVCVSSGIRVFSQYMPTGSGSGTTGSYGNSIFSFLRKKIL